jgi:peptidyl-prolyl cis-trans isomerase C
MVKFRIAILALSSLSSVPAMFAQLPAPPKGLGVPTAVPSAAPPAAAAAPAAATDPAKVVLTIGTEKITAAQYDELVNSLPAQYQTYARGPGKRAFAEQLAQVKVLSQEAEKRKLDQDPKIKDNLAFQRQNLLAQAMFLSLQDGLKIDDAAIEKYYNEHKNEYEALKGRHILIRVKGAPMQAVPGKPELTDEEALAKAQEIRKRLVGGEDFAKVAAAESDDTGSGAQGGDLGEFRRGMMVPPFEEAAFAAKVGEISQPVKTPFGYHLIQVQAHTTKSVAEVKPDIEKKIRPDLAKSAVESMRKNTAVQLDDAFFGPAVAEPGPTAAK